MKGKKRGRLIIAFVFLQFVAACKEQPTHTASYLNKKDDVKITMNLYQAHPYLAEYDRELVFGSVEEIFDYRDLPMDTGGYAAANLYRCGVGRYLLDGYATDEHIGMIGGKSYDGDCKVSNKYLGVFTGGGSLPWRFCDAKDCPEKTLRMRGG